MPANEHPVEPFDAARHVDLQADLHFFFDALVTEKRVLDVGAGLGRSKARIRHSRVTTYDPSEHVAALVDVGGPAPPATDLATGERWDIVTAFEVLEHVRDDRAFLEQLDALATQAVFLTTPNWMVHRCRSRHHYREYTPVEFVEVIRGAWPTAPVLWFAYYKDAEGGWCELVASPRGDALKHAVLVSKGLRDEEVNRIWDMGYGRARAVGRVQVSPESSG